MVACRRDGRIVAGRMLGLLGWRARRRAGRKGGGGRFRGRLSGSRCRRLRLFLLCGRLGLGGACRLGRGLYVLRLGSLGGGLLLGLRLGGLRFRGLGGRLFFRCRLGERRRKADDRAGEKAFGEELEPSWHRVPSCCRQLRGPRATTRSVRDRTEAAGVSMTGAQGMADLAGPPLRRHSGCANQAAVRLLSVALSCAHVTKGRPPVQAQRARCSAG